VVADTNYDGDADYAAADTNADGVFDVEGMVEEVPSGDVYDV